MDYTSIKVGQLPSAAIAGTNLIPHEVDGLLKKATITDLAAFISANGAVGFRAVSVANGGTLPSTTQQEFILVGPGTYNNVGGGSPITVTEELNALVSNGTFWFIGVQIPIDAAVGGTANWGGITGTLSAQTDLQTALNNKQNSSPDLSSIAGLTGTTGLLRKTAANTYSLDTNSYATSSQLHDAVTIGTANGLSLSTQVLSLALASSSTNGALSSTDWNTFNGKQNALTNPITGTGTTNYLPKFTSGSVLGNSAIYESGGNVGIGTTSLNNYGSTTVTVASTATNNNSALVFKNSNDTLRGHFYSDGANGLIVLGSATNSPLTLVTNDTERMRITPGGNVGIGTTSPDIYSFGGSNRFLTLSSTESSSYAFLALAGGAGGGGDIDFGNQTIRHAAIASLDGSVLGFYTNGSNSGTAVTERMRITSGGNVGINKTNPTQRLDVDGLINSTNGISVGGSGVSVVWTGTQAAYDAIATKSSTTIYFIQ
jgi:hypothetical protein